MLKVFNHIVSVQSIQRGIILNDADSMIENTGAFVQFVSYEKFWRHEGLLPFTYYKGAGCQKKK